MHIGTICTLLWLIHSVFPDTKNLMADDHRLVGRPANQCIIVCVRFQRHKTLWIIGVKMFRSLLGSFFRSIGLFLDFFILYLCLRGCAYKHHVHPRVHCTTVHVRHMYVGCSSLGYKIHTAQQTWAGRTLIALYPYYAWNSRLSLTIIDCWAASNFSAKVIGWR